MNAFRDARILDGDRRFFHVFGPTCDTSDYLPEVLELPATIDD